MPTRFVPVLLCSLLAEIIEMRRGQLLDLRWMDHDDNATPELVWR
jgi:hypothetical protein